MDEESKTNNEIVDAPVPAEEATPEEGETEELNDASEEGVVKEDDDTI